MTAPTADFAVAPFTERHATALLQLTGWGSNPRCPQPQLWAMAMQDVHPAVVLAAAMDLVCTSPYPPSIAEVRRAALRVCGAAPMDWEAGWAQARRWATWQANRATSMHRTPDQEPERSPLTVAAMRVVTWTEIADRPNDATSRAQFRDAYLAAVNAAERQVLRPGGLRALSYTHAPQMQRGADTPARPAQLPRGGDQR